MEVASGLGLPLPLQAADIATPEILERAVKWCRRGRGGSHMLVL